MPEKTIRVFVDDLDQSSMENLDVLLADLGAKQALPQLEEIARRTVDVSVDMLEKSVSTALANIFALLSNIPLETGEFEVNEIRFALRIEGSGEVSLMSLASGGIGGEAGLEFTITRRHS